MNKAFEKILERLKEVTYRIDDSATLSTRDVVNEEDAKEIVQEVAEEYNGGWTPCSERLPDIEVDVLLTLRSLDIYTGFRANTDGYFYVEGTDDGYIPFDNVIAWQPLPQPYKERE